MLSTTLDMIRMRPIDAARFCGMPEHKMYRLLTKGSISYHRIGHLRVVSLLQLLQGFRCYEHVRESCGLQGVARISMLIGLLDIDGEQSGEFLSSILSTAIDTTEAK